MIPAIYLSGRILYRGSRSYPKAGSLPVSGEGGSDGALPAIPVTVPEADVVVEEEVALGLAVVVVATTVVPDVDALLAVAGRHWEYQSFE